MTEKFENCLTANPVFYRTYSRVKGDKREKWKDVCRRTTDGLTKLGNLTQSESDLVYEQQLKLHSLTSGRYLWVGGTEWSEQPENFPGVYNCSSTAVDSWDAFSLIMDVTMMGCGAGAMLEPKYINQLPPIRNKIDLSISQEIGTRPKLFREENTSVVVKDGTVIIHVGDSRKGWVDGYTSLLETSSNPDYSGQVKVLVDLSSVRPMGEKLKGFGGVSNPALLPDTFINCTKVLNKSVGRQLNSLECCLLIDHAALAIVAGSIRRSAGIKQSCKEDDVFTTAKDNLWQQDEHGNWSIDPERDALRMSNHTRVFHTKPTRDEVLHAVNKQYYSGEGAIQWVGESIARANCDLPIPKQTMIEAYENGTLEDLIRQSMPDMDDKEISHRLQRYGLNPCLTADNWVLTADGPRTVLDLVGEKFDAVIHGDTVPSDGRGFWVSGIKEVYKLETHEGFSIRLTDNHKLQKSDGQWIEVKDLKPGDTIALHNHRGRFDEKCFEWLCHNFLKKDSISLQEDIEFPIVVEGNKEHLENIQRYLLWLGVFSLIQSTDRKSSLVLRGESQDALRELVSYYFHREENILTKEDKPVIATVKNLVHEGEEAVYDCSIPDYHYLDCNGFVTHNCGEIIMYNNFCNLGEVHLNLLDPNNEQEQYEAFKAASLSVAALLHHNFVPERYQYSREVDPIVGVSFTGLFDFFVNAFGVDWLKWWEAGRPEYYRLQVKTPAGLVVENANVFFKEQEQAYLNKWKVWVHDVIWEYCDRHGLRRPNRCTTVQPAGCLDKTALRVFEQGLFYADEFMSPGQGDVSGFNLTVRNGMTVRCGIANQLLPIVKVTLKNSRILRMTHDHRLSVDGKWVRADNLTEGMTIDFSLGEYDKKDDAVLLPLDQSHYTREYREQVVGHARGVLTKEITTPSVISPDLGYFLGCMFGNGSFSKTSNRVGRIRFSFAPKNMEIVERLQSIAEKLFGLHGVITYDSRNPESKLDLCFASNQLFDWFNLNGLDKVKSKNLDRIPLSIRRSSKETILSFICGLIDTDGCIRSKGSLSIDSASESFVRNLQQIGEAVGLSFSVFHNTQGQNLQKEKDMWGLCLSRMVSKPESLNYLNKHSYKCQKRNLFAPKRFFKFNPYSVESIEFETIPDYTYDFSVDGIDDNDSWYWQGGLKSHNSKSLLTGASPGWHPPKSQRFIRRITFRKDDPVALACIDYGYNVIPSQSDKDENGKLLNDPYDPRCTEWLVEIPVEVGWANIPGADTIEIHNFSVLAQFDFYMQVQQNYTAHNCFSRDTAFLTDKGIKTFESFIPGENVKVLNAEGDWVDSTVVRTEDERTMYEITLRQGSTGKIKKIIATGCHRFPVRRASGGNSKIKTLTTLQLKPGHRLVTNYADLPDIDETGIIHGMVWGDGSRYRHSGKGEYKGSQLYLCGAKRELVGYLEKYQRIYRRDDIDQIRVYGLPIEYKSSLPEENCSQSYLAGFIAGLLATDGNISCSTVSISTSEYDVTRFLERQAPRLGMSVTSINWFESSSYKEGGGAYQVVFSKNSFPENLILRSHHREEMEGRGNQPRQWKVVSIEELPEKQYGWCVMEPVTNHFTLAENILVMNTSATLEFRENEIEPLADRIYQAIRDDEGYISAALLARFDDLQAFPRLPFEPISKEVYERMVIEMKTRQKTTNFHEALSKYDFGDMFEAGPAGCDSDKCLIGTIKK